ncbi:tetraspanin-8-like [Micropterus salmoides]|uniref:tetraspanin-8-like n=1 Tax=Micropterus salmoides TaxID=27706 RepID=UPI0018ECE366|nr:tetraspanin-8-like [Micropterus salmoides]
MGKVNVWLNRSYIIVTSVIAILSVVLLGFTLFGHGSIHDDEEVESMTYTGVYGMYGISSITLLLTITGLCGAQKKNQCALILFAVGMILNSLYMSMTEIALMTARSMFAKELKGHYLQMLPLANASDRFIDNLNNIQMDMQCCGLDQGYQDWDYHISKSCMCTEESTNPCVAAPRNSSLFEHVVDDQPIMIYKEPCIPLLTAQLMTFFNISVGVMLGVILLMVLSIALCIAILCQLRRKEDTPTVVYTPEAKAGNYAVLVEPEETI